MTLRLRIESAEGARGVGLSWGIIWVVIGSNSGYTRFKGNVRFGMDSLWNGKGKIQTVELETARGVYEAVILA